jgi:hypothetical protein
MKKQLHGAKSEFSPASQPRVNFSEWLGRGAKQQSLSKTIAHARFPVFAAQLSEHYSLLGRFRLSVPVKVEYNNADGYVEHPTMKP